MDFLNFTLTSMDKSLPQITLEFFGQPEEPKEFLSGQPMPESKPQPQPRVNTRGRRSLKEMESEAEQVEVPEDEILFQK